MITTVLRLSIFPLAEIDLKEAQRFFAQKFSCGASVTGEDEIIIQGDFTDDIIDVIQEKWPEVINPSFCQEHTHFSTPACDFPVIFGKGFHLWQHRLVHKNKRAVVAFPPYSEGGLSE